MFILHKPKKFVQEETIILNPPKYFPAVWVCFAKEAEIEQSDPVEIFKDLRNVSYDLSELDQLHQRAYT